MSTGRRGSDSLMGTTPLRWWFLLNQKVAASRPGSWAYSHTLHHIDRVLIKLSRGRLNAPRLFTGLPMIQLTTIGAKTGKERTVPVLGLRDGEKWVVVASNWGKQRHPAWYHNLKANPEVTVTDRNRSTAYVAREASEDERQEYWPQAREMYVGYEVYEQRSGDRDLPIIVLEPSTDDSM